MFCQTGISGKLISTVCFLIVGYIPETGSANVKSKKKAIMSAKLLRPLALQIRNNISVGHLLSLLVTSRDD